MLRAFSEFARTDPAIKKRIDKTKAPPPEEKASRPPVSIRLPDYMLDDLDALVVIARTKGLPGTLGAGVDRSKTLRVALAMGLKELRKQLRS